MPGNAARSCLIVLALAAAGPVASQTPPDDGTHAAVSQLAGRVATKWLPPCDMPGGKEVRIRIRFTLSPDGHFAKAPAWINTHSGDAWWAGARSALEAVAAGEPYTDLPQGLYNVPIVLNFDADRACEGR